MRAILQSKIGHKLPQAGAEFLVRSKLNINLATSFVNGEFLQKRK